MDFFLDANKFFLDADHYQLILQGAFVYVAIIVMGGFVMPSPYGRFASNRFGINMSPRLGWFLMELPATLSFIYFYFQGQNRFEAVPLFFLGIWLMHYANRGFIFPFLIRTAKGSVVASACW